MAAGAKKLDYGSDARLGSLVLVSVWPLYGSPSFGEYTPSVNYGPLHILSFDANDVLTLQPDDGSVTLYFDAAARQFLASPADAPPPPPNPTSTPPPQPGTRRIRLGRPSMPRDLVEVPLVAEGTGSADYAGFRVHLRWDASVFKFRAADSIWGEFADATCVQPVVDPRRRGGGVRVQRSEPVGSECSALHLEPASPGIAGTAGTYTIDRLSAVPQTDTYMDGASGANGVPCDAPRLATAPTNALALPAPTATPGGPSILAGDPALSNGLVTVPINTAGPGFRAFSAFSIHLRWDPAAFTFASASASGGVLGSLVCPSAVLDPDGAGAVFACASLGGGTQTTGLLATFALSGRPGGGCSALHLFTYGGMDNGDTSSGTFTVDALTIMPQTVAYVDGSANTSGARC